MIEFIAAVKVTSAGVFGAAWLRSACAPIPSRNRNPNNTEKRLKLSASTDVKPNTKFPHMSITPHPEIRAVGQVRERIITTPRARARPRYLHAFNLLDAQRRAHAKQSSGPSLRASSNRLNNAGRGGAICVGLFCRLIPNVPFSWPWMCVFC